MAKWQYLLEHLNPVSENDEILINVGGVVKRFKAILFKGNKGDTGKGISDVIKVSSEGLIDKFNINYSDGTKTEFNIVNGKDAPNVIIQYSSDNISFHDSFISGDKYIRFSVDGNKNWSSGIKFIGENGQGSGDLLASNNLQDLLDFTVARNNLSVYSKTEVDSKESNLQGYIDAINTILNSDDTTLDELQEIVNFIKQNKSTLDTLGVSNIAGLQDILDSKANASDVSSIDIFSHRQTGTGVVQIPHSLGKIPSIVSIDWGIYHSSYPCSGRGVWKDGVQSSFCPNNGGINTSNILYNRESSLGYSGAVDAQITAVDENYITVNFSQVRYATDILFFVT